MIELYRQRTDLIAEENAGLQRLLATQEFKGRLWSSSN
jgi:hypothetical protein